MTPQERAAEIARGLTKAQRDLLLDICEWGSPLCTIDVDGRPRLALERKGLIERDFDMPPTDLGREVAAILSEQQR